MARKSDVDAFIAPGNITTSDGGIDADVLYGDILLDITKTGNRVFVLKQSGDNGTRSIVAFDVAIEDEAFVRSIQNQNRRITVNQQAADGTDTSINFVVGGIEFGSVLPSSPVRGDSFIRTGAAKPGLYVCYVDGTWEHVADNPPADGSILNRHIADNAGITRDKFDSTLQAQLEKIDRNADEIEDERQRITTINEELTAFPPWNPAVVRKANEALEGRVGVFREGNLTDEAFPEVNLPVQPIYAQSFNEMIATPSQDFRVYTADTLVEVIDSRSDLAGDYIALLRDLDRLPSNATDANRIEIRAQGPNNTTSLIETVNWTRIQDRRTIPFTIVNPEAPGGAGHRVQRDQHGREYYHFILVFRGTSSTPLFTLDSAIMYLEDEIQSSQVSQQKVYEQAKNILIQGDNVILEPNDLTSQIIVNAAGSGGGGGTGSPPREITPTGNVYLLEAAENIIQVEMSFEDNRNITGSFLRAQFTTANKKFVLNAKNATNPGNDNEINGFLASLTENNLTLNASSFRGDILKVWAWANGSGGGTSGTGLTSAQTRKLAGITVENETAARVEADRLKANQSDLENTNNRVSAVELTFSVLDTWKKNHEARSIPAKVNGYPTGTTRFRLVINGVNSSFVPLDTVIFGYAFPFSTSAATNITNASGETRTAQMQYWNASSQLAISREILIRAEDVVDNSFEPTKDNLYSVVKEIFHPSTSDGVEADDANKELDIARPGEARSLVVLAYSRVTTSSGVATATLPATYTDYEKVEIITGDDDNHTDTLIYSTAWLASQQDGDNISLGAVDKDEAGSRKWLLWRPSTRVLTPQQQNTAHTNIRIKAIRLFDSGSTGQPGPRGPGIEEVVLANKAAYDALGTKASDTLYYWPRT